MSRLTSTTHNAMYYITRMVNFESMQLYIDKEKQSLKYHDGLLRNRNDHIDIAYKLQYANS